MKPVLFGLAAAAMAFGANAQPVTPDEAAAVIEASDATIAGSNAVDEQSYIIDANWADLNMSFSVRLGNCSEEGACGYAMMFATFQLGEENWESLLRKANSYNDSYPLGRAFVIPGQDGRPMAVGVDYSIDLTGDASFDGSDVSMFRDILTSFVEHWTGTS